MRTNTGTFGPSEYGGGAHPADLKKEGTGEETVVTVGENYSNNLEKTSNKHHYYHSRKC